MQQQRSRRYKSYITKLLLKTNVVWDTCAITTGTQFMTKLTESLFNYKFTKNVKISSSNEAGEGEHKIFEYIRDNSNKLKNEDMLIMIRCGFDNVISHHVKYVNNIYLR